jgi:hypothetical protein
MKDRFEKRPVLNIISRRILIRRAEPRGHTLTPIKERHYGRLRLEICHRDITDEST